MKQPGFMFYPGDWLKDPALRRCSHAAKGVWMDLLCIMFECDRRGVLATAGRPWSVDEAASAIGGNQDVTRAALRELVGKGACRQSKRTGALWSARLVRDERIRRLRARVGKYGGSKTQAKHQAKLKQSTEYENEDSSQSSEESPRETKPRPRDLIFEAVQELWYGGKVTEPHRGIANRLTADFKSLGATPDEIRRRLGRMKAEWSSGIAKTGTALVKNWHLFAPAGTAQSPSASLASLHRQLAEARAASREHAVARLEAEIAALEAKKEVAV